MRPTDLWKSLAPAIRYILVLFFVSRALLTLLGVYSYETFSPIYKDWYEWKYSERVWLNIWGVWDSGWYLDIAKNGYSPGAPSGLPKKVSPAQTSLSFFPLYPLSMRFVGNIIGNDYVAGLIISNVSLLASCLFLYKLLAKKDEKLAYRAVKYLFLFPTAFILSGVFAESLFLALLLGCFYYAQNKKWLITGILGFLLSLTKHTGIVSAIPLLYLYLRQKNFIFNKIRIDVLYLLLIPLGFISLMALFYSVTGDFFALYHAEKLGWNVSLSNPLATLVRLLLVKRVSSTIIGVLILSEIFLLTAFYKKIDFSHWLLASLLLIIPLASGPTATASLPRLSVVIFPFFILLARLSKKAYLDNLLSVFLALLQGFLFTCWVNGALIM